jgi:uncharacterized protein (DUF1800 family)
MELHTLGVHGGYTQQDVEELARALTGWGVRRRGPDQGQFFFNGEQHDDGEKHILGQVLAAGQGQQDVLQMLEVLASHPATATFIATKLVRRFVADEPPAGLVQRVTQTFLESGGNIKAMLRVIFLSEEFATAPPKLKRPYSFMASALRALNGDVGQVRGLLVWLQMMGQPPFQWPPPDGYPDVSRAWVANMLPRWNFVLNLLSGEMRGATVPFGRLVTAGGAADGPAALDMLAGLILGHPLDGEAQTLFNDYVGSGGLNERPVVERLQEAAALMFASPAFQWT